MPNMKRGEWTFQAIGPGRFVVVDYRGYRLGSGVEHIEFDSMAKARQMADALTNKSISLREARLAI